MRNNEIGFEIKALNNLIKRRVEMSETMEEVEHLTGVHGFVIGYISDHDDEDIFQRDIEEKFEIRRSTATGIINLMEKNGLIIREKVDYDARLKKLVLTDKAREINKLVEDDISRIEKTITKGIDEADLEIFCRVVNKMKDNLNNDMKKKEADVMLRTLGKQIKEYKKASILTPVFVTCEVIMELLIPILMAKIIDDGIGKGNDTLVYKVGALMAVLAMLSLLFGILNGKYAAEASTGFAKNLRKGMYENIQNFSFSNIDKYSTAGLVTRMTTDVTNVQNAYQMIIRMCARAPMMLIIAVIMSISISLKLSMIFIVAIIFLGGCLALIIYSAFGVFDKVFKKYDNVNASVQENVNAIRVVKAYVREDYENKKFNRAIEEVYRLFVKAESRVTLNNPVMMVTVYGCILALSWFGAK